MLWTWTPAAAYNTSKQDTLVTLLYTYGDVDEVCQNTNEPVISTHTFCINVIVYIATPNDSKSLNILGPMHS